MIGSIREQARQGARRIARVAAPGRAWHAPAWLVLGVNKVMRQLSPEEIAMNTWIAEHYVERAERYRRGLKAIG